MGLTPGTRLGPYEVVALLGQGGMGAVYRARDPRLGRDVALKVVPPELADPSRLARFTQEARAAAALNHPHIVAVHDVGTAEVGGVATPYVVTELLEGETLRALLSRGRVPVRTATELAIQIARGLAAAHEQGIVHRDIKPENVWVTTDGAAKVLDFGLAKLRHDTPSALDGSTTIGGAGVGTGPGVVLGTVGYMAPEQVRGEAVDHRADLFALGCLLYELLTGQRAFQAATAVETLSAILNSEPPDLTAQVTGLSGGVERVVRRCLAKAPGQRFQSAQDLAFALEAVGDARSGSGEQAPPTAAPIPRRNPWRERAAWLAIVLVAAGSSAWLFTRETPAPAGAPVYSFINAPDEVDSAFTRGFALSPDGRYLAFVARNRQGQTRLWMRTMATGESVAFEGTDNAYLPFWSPDSQAVAFWSDGKIKRVVAGGGVPQVVCDSSEFPRGWRGGAWLDDDTIVLAHNTPELTVVPASGGRPQAIPRGPGVRRYSFPSWARGRSFFVGVEHERQDLSGVYRLTLGESHPASPILESSANNDRTMLLTSGGEIASSRARTLVIGRMSGAGAPGELVPLAPDIDAPQARTAVAVSHTGLLSYRRRSAQPRVAWFSRDGRELEDVVLSTAGAYRISPDGRFVAADTTNDVWVYDVERKTRQRLTATAEAEFSAVWAGTRRLFWRELGSRRVFVHDFAQARTMTHEFESLQVDGPITASADGRTVVSASGEGRADLFAIDLETRERRWLTESSAAEAVPRLSPDDRFVAYLSQESGEQEIYVLPLGGGPARQVSLGGGVGPMWRGDSRELVYVRPDGTFMAVAVGPGASGEFGTPRPLFRTQVARGGISMASRFDMTPDGQRFLIELETNTVMPLVLVQNWQQLLPTQPGLK